MPKLHLRPVPLDSLREGDIIFPHLYDPTTVRFGDAPCPSYDCAEDGSLLCDCTCDPTVDPLYDVLVDDLRDEKLSEVGDTFLESALDEGILNPVGIASDDHSWTEPGTLVNGHHRWFLAAENRLPVRVTFNAWRASDTRHPRSGNRLPSAW